MNAASPIYYIEGAEFEPYDLSLRLTFKEACDALDGPAALRLWKEAAADMNDTLVVWVPLKRGKA